MFSVFAPNCCFSRSCVLSLYVLYTSCNGIIKKPKFAVAVIRVHAGEEARGGTLVHCAPRAGVVTFVMGGWCSAVTQAGHTAIQRTASDLRSKAACTALSRSPRWQYKIRPTHITTGNYLFTTAAGSIKAYFSPITTIEE